MRTLTLEEKVQFLADRLPESRASAADYTGIAEVAEYFGQKLPFHPGVCERCDFIYESAMRELLKRLERAVNR